MSKAVSTIRVLIVDDSKLVRDMIRTMLESEPGIVVAGEAVNGAEAVAKVPVLKPDIVTMDIEMPVMGGLEAIERIMAQHPVPILVITTLTGVRTAFDAVSKGALDVMEKPAITPENVQHLISKVRRLYRVDIPAHLAALGRRSAPPARNREEALQQSVKRSIVAIAASTGGPHAIHSILSQLPATFPVPIVITQHNAEGFTQGMADWLNSGTPLTVSVGRHDESLVAGRVYINPAEHSMRVTDSGVIRLGDRDMSQIYNPSCNTLLTSVATSYRDQGIGLILTGMGNDGVVGMQAIKQAGGVTLAQDEKSSVVFGMNRCAVELGCIDKVLPLGDIPAELMLRVGGGQ